MQETGLKKREERRFKKEREEEEQSKGKKQEAVFSVEKPEVKELEEIAKKPIIFKMPFLQPKNFKELKMREGGFNKVIPKIIVSKIPSLQPKEIKEIKAKIKTFFTEIPAIKTIKREMPKISIETKPFKDVSRKILAFNIMIPSTEQKNINLAVPNFATEHFYESKSRKMDFNLELAKINIPKREVFVPEIGMKTFSGVKPRNKPFIDVIPKVLHPKKEIGEKTEFEEKVNADVSGGEAEREEFELPNLFEFLLGKGAGKISEGKPICIIVEKTKENYEELIAIMCRDIFRENIGGKPTPVYKENIEVLKHEFESLVERKIMVVEKVEKSYEHLIRILQGFFSQDMGFLILVSPEPLRLEDEIRKGGELSANIITVSPPPEIEREDIRDELLKLVRGMEFPFQAQSFGEEFKKSVETFDDELAKRYLNYEKAPWALKKNWNRLRKCSPTDHAQASKVHSAMKAFVWMYEWKKSDKRKIPELESEDRGVDVKIEERNYEIETLFGVGDVMSKLTEKMEKYGKGEKVYFVLRNIDILRNLPLFSSFKRNWRKAGYDVEFFCLDLDKQELVPLEVFKKKLPFNREVKRYV